MRSLFRHESEMFKQRSVAMAVEGKLEITIKFSEAPEAVEVANGHKMFVLMYGVSEVSVTLRPKYYNKTAKDTE